MKQLLHYVAFVGIGTVIGAVSSNTTNGTANAQFTLSGTQSGDVPWHVPSGVVPAC